ncbi:MAG: zinc ribbon domain-containing protein [bacterium]
MTEELRLHWALHEVDARSVAHERTMLRHREQRTAADTRVAAARKTLAALDQRVADAQKRRRVLEAGIADFDEQQHRFERQLEAVTDQRQFDAVRHEIEAVRAKRDVLETEALERLEDEERESAARPERVQALERATHEAEVLFARLAAEAALVQAELDALAAQRATAVAGLAPEARTRYERLRTGRAGLAVAAVRDGACGECHHKLTPVALQEVRRRERLVGCEGCGRLLVLPPDGA